MSDRPAASMWSRATLALGAAVAAAAFALYRSTLLPGVDFGDTPSFQAMVNASSITPRDGYPLYFAIGKLVLWLSGAEPAHALNLASAIEAAIACGLLVLVAAELTQSRSIAVAVAVLFAGSYTFWSQAIIAEVYALHIAFVAATLLALLQWQRRPTSARLALFFAVYALGFGNHLSMILLAPGYTLFLLMAAPGGWRSMFRPRIIAMAALFACLGASQYLWNLAGLWTGSQSPSGVAEALAHFWFDVTKSDWRETMVLNVPLAMIADHARMYWFDLTQQFGPIVPALSVIGVVWLFRREPPRGALLAALYLVNFLFAFGYNVGDTHVFYLPSHLMVALLCGVGLVALSRFLEQRLAQTRARAAAAWGLTTTAAALTIVYGSFRAYRDFPALDRSRDRRPEATLAALTLGIDDRHAVLLTDLNWQVQNGLTYYAREIRPNIAYVRMPEVLQYAPALIQDNAAIGRDVVVTERARRELATAYGPLFRTSPMYPGTGADPFGPLFVVPSMMYRATDFARLPSGMRYVVCLLKPVREYAIGQDALRVIDERIRMLTGGAALAMPSGDYAFVAGRVGESPALVLGSNNPFRRSVEIGGLPVTVRMESWLAADTIRRMGFGHVIAGRRHTMILERGLNLVAFDDSGVPVQVVYEHGIFAAEPRYLALRMPRGDLVSGGGR